MEKLDPLDKLRNKVITLSHVQHSPASQLELKFSFSPCPNLCMYQTNVWCNSSFAHASRLILDWNFDTSLGQQEGQSRYPVLQAQTSSLRPLLRMLRFPDPWSRGTKTLRTRVHVSNSQGTLQLKAKKTLSWKDYRSLPTLKFWEVMGVLVHKY